MNLYLETEPTNQILLVYLRLISLLNIQSFCIFVHFNISRFLYFFIHNTPNHDGLLNETKLVYNILSIFRQFYL
jgi:hypothetical protein